jgi:glycosyltransferase involved in cell wall biosynthesis
LTLDTLLRYWPLTVRLARTVERIQPQIVHVYGTEYAYGLAALRVSRPVLVSIQGIISLIRNHAPSLFYTLQSPIEKKVVRNTRCFDSRTDWANEYIRSQNPDAKIYKLSRAVNAVFFSEQPAAKGMNLLFVGRVERVKGIEDALQAFAIIHREIPSVRLLVAGRGSDTYVTAMRTYSRILGISDHVEWLGQRTAVELAGLYAQCSLLLHPTHIDNSPNSVAEAMAAGLPVVASNVGGIPSMVDDGVNGKLVKSGDPQALAKVVLTLLRDDGLRCAISAQAREKAEALFRPDRVAEETMKIYRAML